MNISQNLTRKRLLVSSIVIIAFAFLYGKITFIAVELEEFDNVTYEADHSFTAEATNLIGVNSVTEKLKSRLNKYDIKFALDEVFLSEGLNIDSDMTINQGGVNIPVSTFDFKTNIGYLLIDYDRLGDGLSSDKLGKEKTLRECEVDFLKFIDKGLELYFDDEEKFLDDVFGSENEEPELESYDEIVQKLWKIVQDSLDNGGDRARAFREYRIEADKYQHLYTERGSLVTDNWDIYDHNFDGIKKIISVYGTEIRSQIESFSTYGNQREYLEIVLQELKKKLEVEYISSKVSKSLYDEWKLAAAQMIEEPDRYFGFIGMIDNIRLYSPTMELTKQLNKQIIKIIIESDSKKWWAHSNALFALLNENNDPGLFSKRSYKALLADIISNKEYTKWNERYGEIHELGDKENLSLKELKSLDRLAIKNGLFIAPISVLDDRMIYDMGEEKYLENLANLRAQISESKSKPERKERQEELLELSQYRATQYAEIRHEAKAKSIVKLQADMCDYIQWAKNQADRIKKEKSA